MKIAVINGPNMKLLGIREPDIYGHETYKDLCRKIKKYCRDRKIKVSFFQSDCEGDLVRYIGRLYGKCDGIVINPAGYTHTSVALHDALSAVRIPAVEVHISDPDNREEWRKANFVRDVCVGTVSGEGTDGYLRAISMLSEKR